MTKPLPPANPVSAANSTAWLIDLPITDYQTVHRLQEVLVDARLDKRIPDCLILVEHPSVYTLGNRGGRENLMVPESFLRERDIALVQTKRGGDITYHGPGQLVAYPIIGLRARGLTVPGYVHLLEEMMIRTAQIFSIRAERSPRGHGVWCGTDKIGSLGISVRRGISYHGLALNVCPDLAPFEWIRPCGLHDVSATSIARERQAAATVDDAKRFMLAAFHELFGVEPKTAPFDREALSLKLASLEIDMDRKWSWL